MKLLAAATKNAALQAFLLLLAHGFHLISASSSTDSSSESQHSRKLLHVFKEYGQPDHSVLNIDLDLRSILARTALASTDGLEQAARIYKSGVNVVPTTLQSLSTGLSINNANSNNFDLYETYVSFYGGEQSYADTWIQAALDRSNINLGGRKADFMQLGVEGRSAAVRWGTVTLNIWMAINFSLAKSIQHCDSASSHNKIAQENWDDAFSFYTGSLAESDHPLGGYLFFNFAQMNGEQFGTCKKGKECPANTEMLQLFVKGKKHIAESKCSQLDKYVKRMQALMTVPLIQAYLKTSYALDLEDDARQETQGEAAAFSAALAPIVSACNAGSADILFKDLAPGNAPTSSFEVAKFNLERSYDCLGISCGDVGGLVTLSGEYFYRAEACDGVQPVNGAGGMAAYTGGSSSSSSSSVKATAISNASGGGMSRQGRLALGLTLGLTSIVVAAAVGLRIYSNKSSGKEFDTQTSSPELEKEGVPPSHDDCGETLEANLDDVEMV